MSPARFPMALLAAALAAGATAATALPAARLDLQRIHLRKRPVPSAHASTIVETKSGLVAAWFGGSDEGSPDVGIWTSRDDGKGWTPPVEVARWDEGGKRLPCWNPVLFQPKGGPLWLFYKAGPTPANWWGMLISSRDDGKTWSNPSRLPDGFLGPVKNKPVVLAGRLDPLPHELRGPRLARPFRTHHRPRPDLADRRARRRRQDLGRHPADPAHPPRRPHPGPLAEPAIEDRRMLVGRRRQDLVEARRHLAPQPRLRHRRRHPRRRPPSARLQPHRQGPQPAQRRHLARRQDLEDRPGARGPARRILLPRRDPVGRRPGAHHLHVAPQEDPPCRGRPEETGASGDAMRVG